MAALVADPVSVSVPTGQPPPWDSVFSLSNAHGSAAGVCEDLEFRLTWRRPGAASHSPLLG
jgi:hypothetical protein